MSCRKPSYPLSASTDLSLPVASLPPLLRPLEAGRQMLGQPFYVERAAPLMSTFPIGRHKRPQGLDAHQVARDDRPRCSSGFSEGRCDYPYVKPIRRLSHNCDQWTRQRRRDRRATLQRWHSSRRHVVASDDAPGHERDAGYLHFATKAQAVRHA